MSQIISKLQEDHKRMMVLIKIMDREIESFSNGGPFDYFLIETVLDYMRNFPDLCHHPTEDLVFERLKARDEKAGEIVGDLTAEHEELGELARWFSAALNSVQQDTTLPRDWFTARARDYREALAKHIQMEETLFFPAALSALTADDWKAVEAKALNKDDPLFGHKADREYRALHKVIVDWDKPASERA
ncbi:MAG: hemerythrin domain-containing protein [Proteobacteria bacterium]|nr:hemerythrin domain-containing protein [Pseudomonadota bacterium]